MSLLDKYLVTIVNHPLVQIFLRILSFFLLPVTQTTDESPVKKETKQQSIKKEETLFPKISKNEELVSSCKPCSTGISTNVMPFKNSLGEIEWTFTEDDLALNSLQFNQQGGYSLKPQVDIEGEFNEHRLSPTVSNSSSNNDSLLSHKIDTPNSVNSQSSSPVDGNGDQKSHQCPHCEATFKLRGYLTRHVKKHAVKKAYSCPFHKSSMYIDDNNVAHKCHPSGGFSRRDTYKTHLKSRHFIYPKGTKTKERSKTPGSCSMCGEQFPSAEIWCELHIEGGECSFLPAGFKGKSRIKNKLDKMKKKAEKMDDNLLSGSSSDLNETFESPPPGSNSGGSSVDNDSPQNISDNGASPYQNTAQAYYAADGNMSNGSMASSFESPVHFQTQPFQPQDFSHSQSISSQESTSVPSQQSFTQQQQQQQQQTPAFNQFQNHLFQYQFNDMYQIFDYDDEFCLDVEQMNYSDKPESQSFNIPAYQVETPIQQTQPQQKQQVQQQQQQLQQLQQLQLQLQAQMPAFQMQSGAAPSMMSQPMEHNQQMQMPFNEFYFQQPQYVQY